MPFFRHRGRPSAVGQVAATGGGSPIGAGRTVQRSRARPVDPGPLADDPRGALDEPSGSLRHGHRLLADAVARGDDEVVAIDPAHDGPPNGFSGPLESRRCLGPRQGASHRERRPDRRLAAPDAVREATAARSETAMLQILRGMAAFVLGGPDARGDGAPTVAKPPNDADVATC
jgi:hypothetical protein